MTDAAADGRKVCPECAEHVQAAARVCRFCGYRFDVPLGGARGGTGVFGRFQRPKDDVSLPQLLESWGDPLEPGEAVASFGLWQLGDRLDDRDGYLVVTDRRVWFVTPRGERLFRHALAEIVTVAPEKRHLRLAGDGFDHRLRCPGPRGEAERVAALLVRR